MAIINGSITIKKASTLTAGSRAFWAGSVRLKESSVLTAKGNAILSGATTISSSSKLSLFWFEMKASSRMLINGAFIQRLGSVAMSGNSTFTAELVKAAKAFLRIVSIQGEVITSATLEGGGSEYMKTNQNIQLASGDYFEIDVNILDEQGMPKDISAYTFQWTMGGITKDNLNGIQIVDAVNGTLQISLLNEDTLKHYGTYPHKLIMTDVQGHNTTVLKGSVTIL